MFAGIAVCLPLYLLAHLHIKEENAMMYTMLAMYPLLCNKVLSGGSVRWFTMLHVSLLANQPHQLLATQW